MGNMVEKQGVISGENNNTIFYVQGDLSIVNIDEFKEKLIDHIDTSKKLILDCNKLESIDLSIVQLIISLIIERNTIGYHSALDYSNNEQITHFFNKTGLTQVFNKIIKADNNE